ncbi:MAG TPA: maleylpyruvate isomerase family mycothiol-dependent enzyme [Thermomicrobiales bacterium]|nr:maleylpyruvate isomerase family mycothiol-dependent enzyme [Thermomicrobiales bacterium]
MTLPPISTTHLFGPERSALLELLTSLDTDDWYRPTVCNGWNVHDVALHLLGGDVGLLSGGRDRFPGSPAAPHPPNLDDWATLVGWIDARNAAWVDATRRMSPTLLRELLALTGQRVTDWLPTVDMSGVGIPVSWAGPEPAPTWLHIAREYTERWTHQQHIRDAVDHPGFTEPGWLHPVLDTFARALPHTLRDHQRPAGTTVELRITGPAGSSWRVQRAPGAWSFTDTDVPAGTIVTLDEETAWRGFTRGIDIGRIRSSAQVEGDPEIGDTILHMVTIIA